MELTREVQAAIESVQDKKADDIVVLNLKSLTSFTDYFVICTGESEPQLRSISRNLQERMDALGIRPDHVEGRPETGWILVDFDDFIVHIFSRDKRDYYELERLWVDAPRREIRDGEHRQRIRAAR